ncbi:hypothetical protein H4R33_004900 [Dimargaris cristalligena]|uniref:ApaG domain-containing protein n=1 Tax=Dimargaris cristalligena TaxID=215637 RepID=A0A4Q0A298_9FUNG|nr:hypothetical protein H4R33_004900 [Dimargaris cristalligena]RKP40194.1 hypothetical protein BJ085DRAFT_30365 [Dimargaris cristalligena]|eukprot:RKP40194.1 hypothetical protein BJ085DRAFT_30365 [Dimargaris cristalligena]
MDINWCIVCDKHIDSLYGDSSLYCSETCEAIDADSASTLLSPCASPRLTSSSSSLASAGTHYYSSAAAAPSSATLSPALKASPASGNLYALQQHPSSHTTTTNNNNLAHLYNSTRPISIQPRVAPGSYYAYSSSTATTTPVASPSTHNNTLSPRRGGAAMAAPHFHSAFGSASAHPPTMYRVAPPVFNLAQSGFMRSGTDYCTGSGSMYLRSASS